MQQRITPNLWFDTEAEEAAAHYTSIFPNSRTLSVAHYTEAGPRPAGTVMTVEFELDGQRFVGINGGPEFTFSEAGGSEGPCGWCKDKFGLSWQVVPTGMDELFSDPDRTRATRAMQAMFG